MTTLKQIAKEMNERGLTPGVNEPENQVQVEIEKGNRTSDMMTVKIEENNTLTIIIKNTNTKKSKKTINKGFHDLVKTLDMRIN